MLNAEEFERYQRHMALEEVGYSGQQRLKDAKVLCVGLGGLGSPLCLYLASMGIGTLGIIDGDEVSRNNLHRQVLYRDDQCGLKKVELAASYLKSVNPNCDIRLHNHFLTEDNAISIIEQYDIVADCSDNFSTRYLVNDTCCHLKKINVFASIQKFQGHCTVFPAQGGPCYRCLFEKPPTQPIPNCAEAGVLSTTAGIMGLFQANEVAKCILGIGQPYINKLMIFDALTGSMKFMNLKRSPDCSTCSGFRGQAAV